MGHGGGGVAGGGHLLWCVHCISRPWLKPEQDIVLGRFFCSINTELQSSMPALSLSAANRVRLGGLQRTVSVRNKTNPSPASPVPLDTNRAGTSGQRRALAKAQLVSHYPETRCALSIKKPYSASCGCMKTIHSKVKTLRIFKLARFWMSSLTF